MSAMSPPGRPARKPSSARPVADWLGAEATVRTLSARVERLVSLQARLAAGFPGVPLAVVSLDGGTLTLRTPNAAWAARARQSTPTMLAALRGECADLVKIRIVAQRPSDAPAARPREPRAPVPAQALLELERLGSALANPPLEQALRQLVRRQRASR